MADADDKIGQDAQKKIDDFLANFKFTNHENLRDAGYEVVDTQRRQGGLGYVVPLRRLSESNDKLYAGKFTAKYVRGGEQDTRREVATLQALQDVPGIMRYYESFATTTDYVIVTEYFAGGNCQEVLSRQGFFPEAQLWLHAKSLFSTLAQIHAKGFLMADIKAENVMFQEDQADSRVCFVDYGAIVAMTHENAHSPMSYTRYAQSPEIYMSVPVYQTHDIWTMGVLLYFMASGNYPCGEDGSKVLDPVEFKGIIWECHSENLKDLIKACLERIPEYRITAKQALEHAWFEDTNLMTDEQQQQVVRRYFMTNLARRLFHLVSFALRLEEKMDPIK